LQKILIDKFNMFFIDENKDLKNFIQDHLVFLVRGEKKEQKTSTNVKSKRSGSNGA
jgi:hypothetical protein